MYYIRFLKTPKLDVPKCILRALITVTTDLGDSFYAGEIDLHAAVIVAKPEVNWQSRWHTMRWTAGMRSTWIEIHTSSAPPEPLRLFVGIRQSLIADELQLECMPEVFGARSDTFGRGSDWTKSSADRRIERRWRTSMNFDVSIYEETGESIACHIW